MPQSPRRSPPVLKPRLSSACKKAPRASPASPLKASSLISCRLATRKSIATASTIQCGSTTTTPSRRARPVTEPPAMPCHRCDATPTRCASRATLRHSRRGTTSTRRASSAKASDDGDDDDGYRGDATKPTPARRRPRHDHQPPHPPECDDGDNVITPLPHIVYLSCGVWAQYVFFLFSIPH